MRSVKDDIGKVILHLITDQTNTELVSQGELYNVSQKFTSVLVTKIQLKKVRRFILLNHYYYYRYYLLLSLLSLLFLLLLLLLLFPLLSGQMLIPGKKKPQ